MTETRVGVALAAFAIVLIQSDSQYHSNMSHDQRSIKSNLFNNLPESWNRKLSFCPFQAESVQADMSRFISPRIF